jgi:hypothetical protein
MTGAICTKCGHVVTEAEVKNWALNVAAKLAGDEFKKTVPGFK